MAEREIIYKDEMIGLVKKLYVDELHRTKKKGQLSGNFIDGLTSVLYEVEKMRTEKQIDKLEAGTDDYGLMLICAVRYALGRSSYLPHVVIDFITPLIRQLNDKTLGSFERDIAESESLGPDNIAARWIAFRRIVVEEIERRNDTDIVGKIEREESPLDDICGSGGVHTLGSICQNGGAML